MTKEHLVAEEGSDFSGHGEGSLRHPSHKVSPFAAGSHLCLIVLTAGGWTIFLQLFAWSIHYFHFPISTLCALRLFGRRVQWCRLLRLCLLANLECEINDVLIERGLPETSGMEGASGVLHEGKGTSR